MSVLRAARTLGQVSGWTLSNLPMQKTLYIAQMIHLAEQGRPLFPEPFEAWDYGPVVPELYRTLKKFGRGPIADIFQSDALPPGSSEERAVHKAWNSTKDLTAGQLVTHTHREGGAWEMFYDSSKRGVTIPVEWIEREASPNARASDEAVAWAREWITHFEESPARYLDHKDERAFRARLRDDARQQPISCH